MMFIPQVLLKRESFQLHYVCSHVLLWLLHRSIDTELLYLLHALANKDESGLYSTRYYAV